MRIYTYFTPNEPIHDHKLYILVDTLRATTVIAALISVGVKHVKIVSSPSEAKNLKKNGYILVGERDMRKIEGFDLNNSPTEVLKKAVELKNKPVVMTTTNGTKAFLKIRHLGPIVTLSLTNLQSVAEYLLGSGYEDIGIVCAGTNSSFSLEDAYTAGRLIEILSKKTLLILNDAAYVSKYIASDDPVNIASKSFHSLNLKRIGLEKDVILSFRVGLFKVVPFAKKGDVTLFSIH